MIRGVLKADAVVVGELTAILLGPTIELKAKAAFVNTMTGDTCGWTSNAQWSKETLLKLQELRSMMEVDLGQLYLVNGGESVTAPVGVTHRSFDPSTAEGLGEHLGDEE